MGRRQVSIRVAVASGCVGFVLGVWASSGGAERRRRQIGPA